MRERERERWRGKGGREGGRERQRGTSDGSYQYMTQLPQTLSKHPQATQKFVKALLFYDGTKITVR